MKGNDLLFISEWEGRRVKLPLSPEGTYDFTVDWGDGAIAHITNHDQAEITHAYDSGGIHVVSISGIIDGFGFSLKENDGEQTRTIVNIVQWGNVKLHNNGYQFLECAKLIGFSATDTPDLSNLTNMMAMFADAKSFNQDISTWDVSNVTNMGFMFCKASSFNQDLSNWAISKVTDMRWMFFQAKSFNQDISNWDVSNVTVMRCMFLKAAAFNQDLSNWDVTAVSDRRGILTDTAILCQDLPEWAFVEIPVY